MLGRWTWRGLAASAATALLLGAAAAQAADAATLTRRLPSPAPAAKNAPVRHTTTTTEPGQSDPPVIPGGPAQNPDADVSPPAFGPGTTLQGDQQWLAAALTDRLDRLGQLSTELSSARTLTAADRSTLGGLVSFAQATCTSLQSGLGTDTTTASIRAAAAQMIDTLHVFAILTPQVNLTVRTDAQLSTAAHLQSLEPGLNTAIAAAHASKAVVRRLHNLDAAFAGSASAAAGAAGGLAARLTGLHDDDLASAQPSLAAAPVTIKDVQQQLKAADVALHDMLRLLAKPGVTSSSVRRLGNR